MLYVLVAHAFDMEDVEDQCAAALQKPGFINNVDVFEEERCGVHLFFSLLPLAHLPPPPAVSPHPPVSDFPSSV